MIINNLICETLYPEHSIVKLYKRIQYLSDEEQCQVINSYNKMIIKNNVFGLN